MIIEAGVVAGYVIAWATRKAKRIGGRLNNEADVAIDASLDRLHEVVAEKLGGHPVLAELVEEAKAAGEVSGLTRQELEIAITRAAQRDKENAFGRTLMELIARLREAEQAAGGLMIAAPGSTVFTGSAHAHSEGEAIAIAQAGVVNIDRRPDPPQPGRTSH